MTDTEALILKLASLEKECPGAKDGTPERSWHVGSIYDNDEHQLIQDCPTCKGTGTVPEIKRLRKPCIGFGVVHPRCEGSKFSKVRQKCVVCGGFFKGRHTNYRLHSAKCQCQGRTWLPVSEAEAAGVLMPSMWCLVHNLDKGVWLACTEKDEAQDPDWRVAVIKAFARYKGLEVE